jgi:glutaminase
MKPEEKIIDYKSILENIYSSISQEENKGAIATYIPELAKIESDNFGVCLLTRKNEEFGVGNWQTKFSIQSISKVLSLSLAYQIFGDKIWERVDVEPSGTPFNSLVQLESDHGIPRNPFMNSGAMVICDMLLSYYKNPKEDFLSAIRELCHSSEINYSETVAKSEASVGYRNKALCNFIKSFGNIENEPEEVLDFYFHICSIEMSCQELSRVFMFLANPNFTTTKGTKVLSLSQTKRVNAIMQTCGFYDESGEFSFRVGLPGKSGVGGGIVAIYPEKYCITVWSPKLNEKGNSYRGMKFLEEFTTKTEQSIF